MSTGAYASNPVINSVSATPGLVAPGDYIHVIANVTDAGSTVASVTAGSAVLNPTGNGNWEGDLLVDPSLGTHWIMVVAVNAAGGNTTLDNAAQYTTASVFGMNNRTTLDRVVSIASSKFLFGVWGAAVVVDENTFTVSDGSTYPVTVNAANHGVVTGDYVWARGTLDCLTAPPAVLRFAQYSIISMVARQPMNFGDIDVGKNLQASSFGTLSSAAPSAGLKVTITSTDPSRVLLAKASDAAGSPKIVLTMPAGATLTPTFYVQGLAASGSVDLVATAPGGLRKVFKANLFPSGFLITSGNIQASTSDPNVPVTIRSARLASTTFAFSAYQSLRGGMAGVNVPVTSSSTGVGTIVTSPVVYPPAAISVNALFDPANEGTTNISLTTPSGFSTPTTGQSITATVSALGIIASDVSVGKNLQALYQVYVDAPPAPTDITVTVGTDNTAKLGKLITDDGTGSITFSGVSSAGYLNMYVQGCYTGSTTLTIRGTGYATVVKTITVTPSGFVITSGNITTTTLAANSTVTVKSARLNADLSYAQPQMLRGGYLSVSVPVASSNSAVGAITTSPVVFGVNGASVDTQFDPVGGGSSVISITTPTGFDTPTNYQSITATVSGSDIGATDVTVGKDLEVKSGFYLKTVPPKAVDVTLSVDSNGVAKLSRLAADAGSESITLTGVSTALTQDFYVHGYATGTTTLTISAPGYNTVTKTITVTPSGFRITSGNISLATFAPNATVTVQAVRLNTNLTYAEAQMIRTNASVSVPVTSSNTAVGTITNSPVVFVSNSTSMNTYFDPVAAGTSIVSLTTPSGFSTPTTGQSINADIIVPAINVGDVSVVGRDLQLASNCSLAVVPASGVDITVSIDSPTIACVSKVVSAVGSGSVTFAGVTSTAYQSFYVQGRSLGVANLTISAPGYTPVTKTVTVDPSGFVISTPLSPISTKVGIPKTVGVRAALLNPTTLAFSKYQSVRAGIGVSVPVLSSVPGVGTIRTSPLSFTYQTSEVTTTFDPVAVGSTVISVPAPAGWNLPSNYNQINATVTQ